LPFLEDWESNNGVIQTNGNVYSGAGYSWDFETDRPAEGRMRYGTNAYQTYDGSGAMTLDKFPNTGTYAINYAILTIDLSSYAGSTSLELSFYWADHNDEDFPEDKVWIRGSNTDSWVEIYDINPVPNPDNVYSFVGGLDIDATLAGVSQSVSSSFQVRFGQKDNSFTPGDGLSFDNIRIEDLGGAPPTVLPFLEDWESNNGVIQTNGNVYSAADYSWDYETDKPNEGRMRYGTNTYLPYAGSGAMTLDKFPNTGTYATNLVTLTIDLSGYTSSSDLELGFFWADHADEDQADDKVWVRGSNTDTWVEIYDLDPVARPNNTYTQVSGLDIDATLASASQTVSSTFQVRFGQYDNSFTPGDGITFDNISIDEVPPPSAPKLAAIEDEQSSLKVYPNPFSGTTNIKLTFESLQRVEAKIYNLSGELVITLHDGYLEAGEHQLIWDAKNLSGAEVPQGIYIIRVISGDNVEQKTIVKTL
jgi:hypothetical protein